MLLSSLTRVCTDAQKCSRLSEYLKLTVAEVLGRSDRAFRLGHQAVIGAFSIYPIPAPRITGDLDFGRRLQRFSDQDNQLPCRRHQEEYRPLRQEPVELREEKKTEAEGRAPETEA